MDRGTVSGVGKLNQRVDNAAPKRGSYNEPLTYFIKVNKILIFGDICPTGDTSAAFISGVGAALFGEMYPLMQEASYCIANLECALTDNPEPVEKCGPVLYGATACAKTIANAGIRAVSLANNHIRDCGDGGVIATLETCHKAGIATFGAGHNLKQASRAHRFKVEGKQIAVVSFCEREFNYIHDGRMGGKALDLYEDFDRLRVIKTEVDYLIVLFHGGIEYHRYPSPVLQKKCRKMVECGADLVLCQHSHCVGTLEKYLDSHILYGQGNSIFGYRKNNKMWNEGLVVSIDVDRSFKIELIAIQTIEGGLIKLDDTDILTALNERSIHVDDEDFIQKHWTDFCDRQEKDYLPLLWGWNVNLIRINRILKNLLAKIFVHKRSRNISHNIVRCDAHREVIETILNKYDF